MKPNFYKIFAIILLILLIYMFFGNLRNGGLSSQVKSQKSEIAVLQEENQQLKNKLKGLTDTSKITAPAKTEEVKKTDEENKNEEVKVVEVTEPNEDKEDSEETPSTAIQVNLDRGLDTYENKINGYMIGYPKGWWYRGFGAAKDTKYHAEFGTQEIENVDDGVVSFDLLNGGFFAFNGEQSAIGDHQVKQTADGDNLVYYIERDSGTTFRLTGPSNLKEALLKMAESIQKTV